MRKLYSAIYVFYNVFKNVAINVTIRSILSIYIT